jgi:hypothetical protein
VTIKTPALTNKTTIISRNKSGDAAPITAAIKNNEAKFANSAPALATVIIIEAALEVDTLLPNDIQYISIRRTVNFDSEINGTAVDNATISLTDGKNTILTSPSSYLGNGKYELKIKPGSLTKNKVYQLDVKVDNKIYSATSACPSNPVPLDSIGVFKQKTFGWKNISV